MRMDGQEESSNVEDVRGMGGGGGGGGGGGFGFGGRSVGIGSVLIAVLAGWIFGINPLTLLGMGGGGDPVAQVAPQQQGPAPAPPQGDAQAQFVSKVLRSTEQVWTDIFRESGRTYQPPKLVIFSDSYPTACGRGQAAMGPFYCPNDQRSTSTCASSASSSRSSPRPASSRRPTSSPTRSATTCRTSSV